MIRRWFALSPALAFVVAMAVAASASGQALPKPEVGPEKPFAPPPRVERTLANGLQVIAVRYATVPKISAFLTVRAGQAVDPSGKAGLAQFVADTAQEGTTTRSSATWRRRRPSEPRRRWQKTPSKIRA